MQNLTPEGRNLVAEIASRNGVSVDAAVALLDALQRGDGFRAQFNHPDLGGMGQWSQGGMIMIGDMFNNDLKYRVGALCDELAGFVRTPPAGGIWAPSEGGAGSRGGSWWPGDLGEPASVGAQNDMRYAYFSGSRRLAIKDGGEVRVYDTGDHRISGFSQAQSGNQTLSFTSQLGTVRVADLALVSPGDAPVSAKPSPQAAASSSPPEAAPSGGSLSGDAIFAAIERLADLHKKNILGDDEFHAKKRELLSRL